MDVTARKTTEYKKFNGWSEDKPFLARFTIHGENGGAIISQIFLTLANIDKRRELGGNKISKKSVSILTEAVLDKNCPECAM